MNAQAESSFNQSPQTRWLRTGALFWGILVFLWLAPEDDSVLPAALLGLGLSGLVVLWLFIRLDLEAQIRRWRGLVIAAILGVLAGAGTSLSTVLLLLIKNARHAHLYPDYPPELLLDTLARFPAWSLAGGLIGAGWFCARWTFQRHAISAQGN